MLSLQVIADLGQDCGGEAEERGLVWEDRRDTSASLDFLVESLEAVGRAEASPMASRDAEDREGLRKIRLAAVVERGSFEPAHIQRASGREERGSNKEREGLWHAR